MAKYLSFGSRGQDVRNLQLSLNCRPSDLEPLNPDGIFGPKTLARVREFQANNGLVADGIVGPKTLAALSGNGPTPPNRGCDCCNAETIASSQSGMFSSLLQSSRPQNGNQMGFMPVSFSPTSTSTATPSTSTLTPTSTSSFSAPSGPIRMLDSGQQTKATAVYGSSLDFSSIFISNKTGLGGRPFTIAFPDQSDIVQIMNCGTFSPSDATLIHELAHVWQSQHHSNKFQFMANAVKSQSLAAASNAAAAITDPLVALNKDFPLFYPFDAYSYDSTSMSFGSMAAEQMASAIEHGEATIVSHAKSIGINVVDPLCVSGLSTARFADRRLPGVK